MTRFAFTHGVLFSLYFISYQCEGKILLPDDGDTFVVLPGATVTIAWKIDPTIPASDFKVRQWEFVPGNIVLAEIINDQNVTIKPGTIFSAGIDVVKPSTLVLKNVDKRFAGQYRFAIRVGVSFTRYISKVDVFVATSPMVSVDCSRLITLNTGDDFTCTCKGPGGNPPANVTWYKDDEQIGFPEKEVKTLRLNNVNRTTSGKYRCDAKSHKIASIEIEIELIVNYPPENVYLKLRKYGDNSVTMTCEAEARPPPSFKILFNETKLVINDKTYTIPEINSSHVGNYACVAMNILGSKSSGPIYLFPQATTTSTPQTRSSGTTSTTHPPWQELTTTMKDNGTDKVCSNDSCGTEWYIIVVALVSGIIIGILLSYFVSCSRRRWFRKPQSNPEVQTNEANTTYQELDLSKMNTEDNYQSLKVNTASNNALNDDSFAYAELNKTRDAENHYQSLT